MIKDIMCDYIPQFYICAISLIIFSTFAELLIGALLAKIIPADWDLGFFNFGFFTAFSTTLGRTLGSSMLTISSFAAGQEYILTVTYSFTAFLFLVILILFSLNYSNMRVKALARIIKFNKI
jgi:hypothetical protein